MQSFGHAVVVTLALLVCAMTLPFAATFGIAFALISMAVLWMSFVYLAIDRLSTGRGDAADRRDGGDRTTRSRRTRR